MEASVTDGDGCTELCEIMDEDDYHYRMNFTPQMNGTHILSIKHKGMHISGTSVYVVVIVVSDSEFTSQSARCLRTIV